MSLLRTQSSVSRGAGLGPLTPALYIKDSTPSSFYEDHVREYSAYDIKDLYGLTFLEFMAMTVPQSDALIRASKQLTKERESARKKMEDAHNKGG